MEPKIRPLPVGTVDQITVHEIVNPSSDDYISIEDDQVLHAIIKQYYPDFLASLAKEGRTLPPRVLRAIEDYMHSRNARGQSFGPTCICQSILCMHCTKCRETEIATLIINAIPRGIPIRQWVLTVPPALRRLFANCTEQLNYAVEQAYNAIAEFLINRAGLTQDRASAGGVTAIHRCSYSLNLNVYFRMLITDGVYTTEAPHFHSIEEPLRDELQSMVEGISRDLLGNLRRKGLIDGDSENLYLTEDAQAQTEDERTLQDLQRYSVHYQIGLGPFAGNRVTSVETAPRIEDSGSTLVKASGFTLHAGVVSEPHQRYQLERLARNATQPAIDPRWLSFSHPKIVYQLRQPYADGTTHLVFDPIDFLGKLAALVPNTVEPPIRLHGIFSRSERAGRTDLLSN